MGSPDRQFGENRDIKKDRPDGPTHNRIDAQRIVVAVLCRPVGPRRVLWSCRPDLTVGAIDCRRYAAWKT